MPEIKNGKLGLHGAEHSKCNRMVTLGFKGLNAHHHRHHHYHHQQQQQHPYPHVFTYNTIVKFSNLRFTDQVFSIRLITTSKSRKMTRS